eukprot:s6542_g1.t1
MDLDSEEAKFFGRTELDPWNGGWFAARPEGESSTYPMTKGKGKGKKGKGKGRGKGKESPPPPTWDYTNGLDVWEHPWPSHTRSPQSHHYTGEEEYYQQHLRNLTRLVLQQEQTIASPRQDVTLYLFVKTGQGSIEDSPHTLTYSLKIAMFKQLMIELHGRLTAVAKAPEEMEKAKKLNWVDERGHWRVLKWNPQKQELQVDESRPTVPTEDLLKQTVELRKGISEEALHRFRSYKKMTDQPTTEWMQFRLEVSLRPLGDPVWSTLQNWVGQGAWHLLGCRLRRERPQYNGLVDQDGVMRRDSRPLQGHLATVHMPIFQDESEETRSELRCTYASYQVVSMALHFGESPNEGHCQAILNGPPFFGGNKRWLTDDNRPARVHTCETDTAWYRSAIYVVWLRHEPGVAELWLPAQGPTRCLAPQLRCSGHAKCAGWGRRQFAANAAEASVRPPWQKWEEHWPSEKVQEGLCSGQVIRGRLHVPSFQTDTAYVVTEASAESREVWVPVTGFVGRNRALHGDEVAALPLWSPYRADGTKSEPGPSVPEPPPIPAHPPLPPPPPEQSSASESPGSAQLASFREAVLSHLRDSEEQALPLTMLGNIEEVQTLRKGLGNLRKALQKLEDDVELLEEGTPPELVVRLRPVQPPELPPPPPPPPAQDEQLSLSRLGPEPFEKLEV